MNVYVCKDSLSTWLKPPSLLTFYGTDFNSSKFWSSFFIERLFRFKNILLPLNLLLVIYHFAKYQITFQVSSNIHLGVLVIMIYSK